MQEGNPNLPFVSHLPRPLTEFVGREVEISTITELLVDNPLLNLFGPGGIGKTRLAITAAEGCRINLRKGSISSPC